MLSGLLKTYIDNEKFLTETILVNPDKVSKYVLRFENSTRSPQGKKWFKDKLRTALINSPALLYKIVNQNSGYPEYANTALSQGKEVYQFDASNLNLLKMEQEFTHLSDWFNAMQDVMERKPTNPLEEHDRRLTEKELSKIMRYSPEVAKQHADEWFSLMGNRIKGTKHGVEILYTWTSGYYAVKYTDSDTMKMDGNDLQNCLRTGSYWHEVVSGKNFIFGIRKPNDEAIVGIRTYSNLKLIECKGKNNNPVIPAYQQYVIDFLNFMKITGQDNQDLLDSNIYYNKGKYGSFTEIAELIYDKDGLQVWKGGAKYEAHFGNLIMTVNIIDEMIAYMVVPEAIPSPVILTVLNFIKTQPKQSIIDALQNEGILYDSNKKLFFGIDQISDVIAEFDGFRIISLQEKMLLISSSSRIVARARGDSNIFDKSAFLLSISSSPSLEPTDLVSFLNVCNKPPSPETELMLAYKEIAYNNNYSMIKDMEMVDREGDSATLYKGQNHWIAVHEGSEGIYNFVVILRKKIIGLDRDGVPMPILVLIRRFLKTNRSIKTNEHNDLILGIMKYAGKKQSGLLIDVDDFIKNIKIVAQQYTSSPMTPFVSLDNRLRKFLIQQDEEFDTKLPDNFEELLLRNMTTDKKVYYTMNNQKKITDIDVTEFTITFPTAAAQICSIFGIKMTLISDEIGMGINEAIEKVKKSKNEIYNIKKDDNLVNYSTLYLQKTYLQKTIENKNEEILDQIQKRIRNAASVDISDRFAMLNMQRKVIKQ